jgi:hypothetical protein
MAVVRIRAEWAWFRAVAATMYDHPRLARELERAAVRPGRTAELTLPEARAVAERLPYDPIAVAALGAGEESAARDRERLEQTRAMMNERRAR